MNILKENYKNIFVYIKNNLSKIILGCSILFVICMLSGIIFGFKYSDITEQILKSFIENKSDIISDYGNINALGLIKNNGIACIVSIIIGFFPFIFLPILTLLLNGFLVGVTLGFGQTVYNMSIIKVFVFGILPHGIFEIPSLIISISMGLYLCLNITKKIIGKTSEKISNILIEYIRIFICIILPLLIIAGLVESYITPTLLK